MVSTGATAAVFRTTMRVIFGNRGDSNGPLTTMSTSSQTTTPSATANRLMSSLQPTSQSGKTTNFEANNTTSVNQHNRYIHSRNYSSRLYTRDGGEGEEEGTGTLARQVTVDFPDSYTRNIIISHNLLDITGPANTISDDHGSSTRTNQWQLVLNPKWTEYVLVYCRLEYGLSVLTQLLEELKPYIEYYQVLNSNQGILVHLKGKNLQYRLLQLSSQVIGFQFVISSPSWFYTVTNYDIINLSREYNLQVIKYKKIQSTKHQMQVISLYGIPSFVPKELLIDEFRQLGKLVSFKFAPTGPSTRFHVVQLQYSKSDHKTQISENIRKIVGSMKCKIVFRLKVTKPKPTS
ncbi:hypothetical protein CANMA_000480 [Candida margitis]|uniref:uncharacterized protein n=1 Tax=Candida margitis TaxID=1775924 RepID=UPI002226C855|nr:uncharacterized protein CANMA_000480 [Candida margitis]KAI5970429.1 hypothetical protein CANMA_000480 [Candida margitis]